MRGEDPQDVAIAVRRRIVRHHAAHGDPQPRTPARCRAEEAGAGRPVLARMQLRIGNAGRFVDGDVPVVLAKAAMAVGRRALAINAMPWLCSDRGS